jgi:hypothetical protein
MGETRKIAAILVADARRPQRHHVVGCALAAR